MFFGCLGEEKDPEDYERGFDNWRGLFKRRMMLSFAEARNQINAKMATSGETEAGGSSQDSSNIPEPSEAFNEFYAEVSRIRYILWGDGLSNWALSTVFVVMYYSCIGQIHTMFWYHTHQWHWHSVMTVPACWSAVCPFCDWLV